MRYLANLVAVGGLTFFLVGLDARPAHAACGMGNQCPIVDTLTASPAPVPAGTTTLVTCSAHDDDGSLLKLVFRASAGTFAGGVTQVEVPASASVAIESLVWSAPAAPGSTAQISCTPWDMGGYMGIPGDGAPVNLVVNVSAAVSLHVTGLTASPASLLPGETAVLQASVQAATDVTLSYAWSAAAGVLSGQADLDPERVSWTAPATPGLRQISLHVSASNGDSQNASVSVNVAAALAQASYQAGAKFYPARLAVAPDGVVYALDPRTREVTLFNARGDRLQTLKLPGRPAAIAAAGGGVLYVADADSGAVSRLDAAGRVLAVVGAPGTFGAPVNLAWSPETSTLWIGDRAAGRVFRYSAAGTELGSFAVPGELSGLAVNGAGTRAAVGDNLSGTVRVYGATGTLLVTAGTFGSGLGANVRVAGVAMDASGALYVADAYRGRVSVYDPAGTFVATVGSFGSAAGELRMPLDAVVDTAGRLVVANTDNKRLEVFKLVGTTVVVAPLADLDLDGVPDAWELLHGLNASDPADGRADGDGDGLLNVEEWQAGTDPAVADSDADGVSDGVEVALGFNPLWSTDQVPTVSAVSLRTAPALVTLFNVKAGDPNQDPLTATWAQTGGPAPALILDPQSPQPRVLLRKAGDYVFQVSVSDGKIASAPVSVNVTVDNAAPVADAGADLSAAPGRQVFLDARFSSDANGDALTYAWRQTGGPAAALLDEDTATPVLTPVETGLYTFEVTVSDGAAAATAATHVYVESRGDHVPVAAAAASGAFETGLPVFLDGRRSADSDGALLRYAWRQLDGPAAALEGADSELASFTPAAPGNYRFALDVSDGTHAALAAEVAFAVGTAAQHAPAAEAGYLQLVRTLDVVTLSCALSDDADGDALACTWRQVEGEAVALTSAGDAAVRFTPITVGAYEFELTVEDAGGLRAVDRVVVVADDPLQNRVPLALPMLGAGTPRDVMAGDTVTLEAGASRDADLDPLAFLWTQVKGGHVALSDARAARATWVPLVAGNYAFELRVSDGQARSPRARVELAVGSSVNGAPVAAVDGDKLTRPGEAVTLSAAGSYDPDGDGLTYAWVQVAGPLGALLAGEDTAELSVTPRRSGFTQTFELTAGDGALDAPAARVNVSTVDVPLGLVDGAQGGVYRLARPGEQASLRVVVETGTLAAPAKLAFGEVDTPEAESFRGPWPTGMALFAGPIGFAYAHPIEVKQKLSQDETAETVGLVRYDYASHTWHAVRSLTVDPMDHSVTFEVAAPGLYQLVSDRPAAKRLAENEGSGCGCHHSPAESGDTLLLVLLAVYWSARRWFRSKVASSPHRLIASSLFVFVVLALAPAPALATDAPHDLSKLVNGCYDCHDQHLGPGATLTNVAGNDNLCRTCHATKGINWAVGDQAAPASGTGNSHRWDANVTNPLYGSLAPLLTPMSQRTPGDMLICSTCHDVHQQASAPLDPLAPASSTAAGRHFMRLPNNSDQMCRDCHRTRDMTSSKVWTGSALSHPVGTAPLLPGYYNKPPKETSGSNQAAAMRGTSTGGATNNLIDTTQNFTGRVGQWVRFRSGANNNVTRQITSLTGTPPRQINFAVLTSGIVAGVTYEIDGDGNATNDMVFDYAGTPSTQTGNVQCESCHGLHYADSNATTYDAYGLVGAGDGMLLKRANNDETCNACHNVKLHNSTNTSTTYGTWGQTFTCATCHDVHGSKNVMLVREQIVTPASGTKTVDYRYRNGSSAYSQATAGNGPCEVCHTKTKNADLTPRYRNTGDASSSQHYPGLRCTSCHTHQTAFKAPPESLGGVECSACHYQIWARMNGKTTTTLAGVTIKTKHTIGQVVDKNDNWNPNDPAATWTGNLATAVTWGTRSCTNMCHNDHSHAKGTGTTHTNPVWMAATDSTWRIYGSAGVTASTDFVGNGKGLCISCHQNATDTDHPAISATGFDTSAHDFASNTVSGLGTFTYTYTQHDGAVFQRNCTKCHTGEDDTFPAETVTPVAAVHYSENVSLLNGTSNIAGNNATFSCYKCHGDTATAGWGTNRSGKNIAAVFRTKAVNNSHPVASDSMHDSAAEYNNGGFGSKLDNRTRHAGCEDCHNPHTAKAGTHAVKTNVAGPPLEGAWGAELLQTSLPAFWTAPSSSNFAKKTIVAGTDLEATLCFKCHSAYFWGNTATSAVTRVGTPSAYVQTDTAKEFNPNNTGNFAGTWASGETAGGFHPVLATAGNNLGAVKLTNLVTTNIAWSTTTRNLMTCSDCHESDNTTTDPNGPHGSTAAFILRGPNTKWDNTVVGSSTGMVSGTFCMNCHAQNFSNSRFASAFSDGHGRSDHYQRKCFNCHSAIPHGTQQPGLLVIAVKGPTGNKCTSTPNTLPVDVSPYRRLPTGDLGLCLNSYPANNTTNWVRGNCACGNKSPWDH